MAEMIGALLNGRYRLDAELGGGGMGRVYRAHDALLDRHVAVKVLSASALGTEGRTRLLREAQSVAQLNHTNIVSVYDAGEAEMPGSAGTVPFIVMELVEGDSLHDCPPGSLDEILGIACQVCAALEHAHAHGVIHRDLKPENILLLPDGSAKLVDFGLARTVASRLTAEGAILGTVFYIAPEQALGQEIDGRADLYALGVMLYEWTAGHLPFEGNDPLAFIGQHLHAPVVPPREHNPEIPPALDALIVQLMSKRREDRPASAAEVQQVLEALLQGPAAKEVLLDRPREPGFLTGAEERRVERPAFVAREQELARLDRFLEGALAGQGRVVFVTGGPGRGKTALLDEFARRAMEAHASLLVASGSCNAYSGVGDPYLPFRDVLGLLTGDVEARWATGTISREHALRLWGALPLAVQALVDHGPHVVPALLPGPVLLSRARAVAPPGAPWLQRLRERVERQPAHSEAMEQSHLFQQVTNLLHAVAEVQPLLLILDDLQWVDTASAGLLFHLGRRLQGSRILVACAYRPEEVALGRIGAPDLQAAPGERERHPLEKALREFKRQYGDVWVDLSAIDEAEGRRFVDAFLETEPNRLGEGFRQALFEHAGGHPLFTTELLRAIQERGGLVRDDDGYWIPGPSLDWGTLPARVEGVIEERIGRLGEELRELLTIASVEGEEFTAQVVACVQEADERRLIRELSQELEKRHRLVREQGTLTVGSRLLSRYRFAHALFQQYLYNDLNEVERRLLHRRVAATLQALHEESTEEIAVQLVRHYAGDSERERYYARIAGERAAGQYANAEALHYLNRALELTPETDHGTRYSLLLSRERVFALIGERESQSQDLTALMEIADALKDSRKAAEVFLLKAKYAYNTCDYGAAAEAAQKVITLTQNGDMHELVAAGHLELGSALCFQGDLEGAQDQLEQALTLIREEGLRRVEADALRAFGVVHLYRGNYAGAGLFFEQALDICRELGDRPGESDSLNNLGAVFGMQGDLVKARACFEQYLKISKEIGNPLGQGLALSNLGVVCERLGDYRRARIYYEQALPIRREVGDRRGEAETLCGLGGVSREALYSREDFADAAATGGPGNDRAALEYSRQVIAIAQETHDSSLEAYALNLKGDVLADLGDLVKASEAYQRALALRRELGQKNLAIETCAGLAALSLARGNLRQALEQVEEILDHLETGTLEGTENPIQVWLTCYRVLQTHEDSRADLALSAAYGLLQERAAQISDEQLRRSFLENVPAHRGIVQEWNEQAEA